jgi:hypothetical protein
MKQGFLLMELAQKKSQDCSWDFFYFFLSDLRYNCSTFSLAQGILRKKFKLDLIVGLLLKQLIGTRSAILSQPYTSTSLSIISTSFTPCKGLFAWVF